MTAVAVRPVRLVEKARRLSTFAGRDHATGMFSTSYGVSALGYFDNPAGLDVPFVPVGPMIPHGGLFKHDGWEVYKRKAKYGVTNPNMVFSGEQGAGKTTTCQVYLRRQWLLRRFIRVIDPSPNAEYHALCDDLGGVKIRIAKGGDVRLNPLESVATRHALLRGMAAAAMRRDLDELEPALLNTALDACGELPVLPEVLELLFNPTAVMAGKVGTSVRQYAREARKAAGALQPLCEGDLKGMFDGPTSEGIDFGNRFVLLDLSELHDSQSLGILMACATSFLQAQIDAQYEEGQLIGEVPKSIMVIDEAWKILPLPGLGEWLQARFKFSRKLSEKKIAVVHAMRRDLDAAGDEGGRMMKLARGLVKDASTFVIHRIQDEDDADETQQMLGLSRAERDVVQNGLDQGDALWRVGKHRFIVCTNATESDLRVTSHDRAMTG